MMPQLAISVAPGPVPNPTPPGPSGTSATSMCDRGLSGLVVGWLSLPGPKTAELAQIRRAHAAATPVPIPLVR